MFVSTLNPVAFSLGSLDIRWYGMAYVLSFIIGQHYLKWLNKKVPTFPPSLIDSLATWVLIGVILGGRLGYVLFYNIQMIWENPWESIIGIRKGGMSFHGGCLGVILALLGFAQRHRLPVLALGDFLCCVLPTGLFLGRCANFVNGETFGRVTDVPWGVVFPYGGPLPRHPSQLYEALTEGVMLGIMVFLSFRKRFYHAFSWGRESGIFLLGYGILRIFCEYFRQPDSHIGYLWGHTTWGQWLSLPLIIAGALLLQRSSRNVS